MDSLTHIALGACIGEAFFGKTIGKKAMLWGALAQSIPDIDFIASSWMDTSGALLAHRGFTHSILFALLIIPLFALSADRIHRPHDVRFSKWWLFFAAEVFTHLFIDAFNNYGVGWFEPFSHVRISFNAIYVADPFFSIWSGIAVFMLLIKKRHDPKRHWWWRIGVYMSGLYLGLCMVNKVRIDRQVRQALADQHIPYNRYFTTPAPLQNWLWYVVAETDSGYRIGFRSLFDTKPGLQLNYFPRNEHWLAPVHDHEDLQQLKRFSQGYYTVEHWGDTLVFNDLRFGQIIGWQDQRERFVFHYFLQQPDANRLVVQRGRFDKWDWQVFKGLLKRLAGN